MQKILTLQDRAVRVEAGDTISFGFPLSDIDTLSRSGDNLAVLMKSGGFHFVQGFYKHLPTVIVKNNEFGAEDFLAAFEEGQLPAEGEDEGEESQRAHDFDVMGALDGIDHLDGLDIAFDGETEEHHDLEGGYAQDGGQDLESRLMASLDPANPDIPADSRPVNPSNPVIPSNPDIPSEPETPAAPVGGEAFADEHEWNQYRKPGQDKAEGGDIHVSLGGDQTNAPAGQETPATQARPAQVAGNTGNASATIEKPAQVADNANNAAQAPAQAAGNAATVEKPVQVADNSHNAGSSQDNTQISAPPAPSAPAQQESVSRDESVVAPTETANPSVTPPTVAETKPAESVTPPSQEAAAPDVSHTVAEARPSAPEPSYQAPADAGQGAAGSAPSAPSQSGGSSTGSSTVTTPSVAEAEKPVESATTPDPIDTPIDTPAVAQKPDTPAETPTESLPDDSLVAQAPAPQPLSISGGMAVMSMRAPRRAAAAPSASPEAQAGDEPVEDAEPERYESEIFFEDGIEIVRVLKQGTHGHVEQIDGRWMYILDEAIDSGDEEGRNIVSEGDQVMLLTRDAKGVTWPIRVVVHIKDDVPELDVKDESELASGHEAVGALTYDFGADDWGGKMSLAVSGPEGASASTTDFSAPLVIAGVYGTLTVNKDGSYSYQARPLGPGEEGGTDIFDFTITDADGDVASLNRDGSPARLTFTTEKPAEPEAPVISDVHEKNLPDGTDPDPDALHGAVTLPDGYTLELKTDGTHGHLVKDAQGNWSYVLDEAIDSGPDQGQNRVENADSVTVIVKDEFGNSWEFDVPVAIVDDAPEADDDAKEIAEGATEPVTGNVLDNDQFGADQPEAKTVEWLDEARSEYGTITLNPDGTYSFTLDNESSALQALKDGKATETFRYQITDADGDTSEAVLTITIQGKDSEITITTDDSEPEDDAASLIVKEENLPQGTDPDAAALTRSGSMDISAPDGLGSLKIGDQAIALDGTETEIEAKGGKLTVRYEGDNHSGKLVYEFTLDAAVQDHSADELKDIFNQDFAVTVTDVDGSEADATLHIKIVDDAPEAADDASEITEGAADPVTGNVLGNDRFGADGKAAEGSLTWLDGADGAKYGEITLNPDGSYSYVLNGDLDAVKALKEGETLTETFRYQITDADGDTSEATLTITINGVNHQVLIDGKAEGSESDVTVHESGLENGTEEGVKDTAAGNSVTITAEDGVAEIKVGELVVWKDGKLADAAAIETADGTLTITGFDAATGQLSYTYTLKDPATHDKADNDQSLSHEFQLTVTDLDGDTATGKLIANVVDDAPAAEADVAEIDEGASDLVTGNVITNDKAGADGFHHVEWPADAEGAVRHGTLTANADGSWSYALDPDDPAVMALKDGETLTETYTYKIYDKDGDWAEATLTITINGKSGEDPKIVPDEPDPDVPSADPEDPDAHGALIKVYEKNLADGTDPDADALTVSGTMQVTAPDGLASVKLGETVISADAGAPTEIELNGGTLTLWLETDGTKAGTLHYSYTLDESVDHPDAKTLDELLSENQLVVTDLEGKTGACNLHVVIVDDGPELSVGADGEAEIGDEVLVPDFEAAFGADSGDGKSFVIAIGGQEYTFGSIEEVADAKGKYGQIDYVEGKGLVYTAWAEQPEIDWDAIDWETTSWDDLGKYYDDQGNFDAIGFLKDQGLELKDEFTFTITDSDGDTATASWSVDLVKDAFHGETDADEALKNVRIQTHENDMGSEVEILLPEGYSIREITEQPEHGTVSRNAEGKWVYVLNEAIDSGSAASRGGNATAGENLVMDADGFKALVETPAGKLAPVEIPVHVIDSVPVVEGGSASLEVGQTVSGSVGLDWGADDGEGKALYVTVDGKETQITADGTEIAGKFGTLTFNMDGTYSYVAERLANKVTATNEDESRLNFYAKNKIDLNISDASKIEAGNITIRNDASINIGNGLHIGFTNADSIPPAGTELEIAYTLIDGKPQITVNGVKGTVSGSSLSFMLDGKLCYAKCYNKSGYGEKPTESFTVNWTSPGEYAFSSDEGDVTWTKIASGYIMLTVDLGNGNSVSINYNRSYPEEISDDTLTIDLKQGIPGMDAFAVKAIDADGDVAHTDLVFGIERSEPELGRILGYEHNLGNTWVDINVPDGYSIIEVIEHGQYGRLDKSMNGNWLYTVEKAIDSGEIQGQNVVTNADSVKLKVADDTGKEWIIEIPVDIEDDVPEVKGGSKALEAGKSVDGTVGLDFGADDGDGKALYVSINGKVIEITADGTEIRGVYGTLTLNLDGSYSYKADNESGTDIFTVKAVDADGDIAQSDLSFKVNSAPVIIEPEPDPVSMPVIGSIESIDLYESGLENGSHADPGQLAIGSGSFTVDMCGDDGTINVGDIAIQIADGVARLDAENLETTAGGNIRLTVKAVELVGSGQWAVRYDCELLGAENHGGSDSSRSQISISATNSAGKSAAWQHITVYDDGPGYGDVQVGKYIFRGTDDGDTYSYEGSFKMSWGADGMYEGYAIEAGVGGKGVVGEFMDGKIVFDFGGRYGTLVFTDKGDGRYSYEYTGTSYSYDKIDVYVMDGDGGTTEFDLPLSDTLYYAPGLYDHAMDFEVSTNQYLNSTYATFTFWGEEDHGAVDGTITIGEAGNQIAIQIVDGKADFNTETADPIVVNGLELKITDLHQNDGGNTWQMDFEWQVNSDYDGSADIEVPIRLVDANGFESCGNWVFKANPDAVLSEPDASSISLLDLFNDAIDDDIQLTGRKEDEQAGTGKETASACTLDQLLLEEDEYADIVLPGSVAGAGNQEAASGDGGTSIGNAAAIEAEADLGMLAARHEIENV